MMPRVLEAPPIEVGGFPVDDEADMQGRQTMTQAHSLSNVRPANNMTLASIVKGKIVKPPRVLLFGVEKIGKSTFAAGAPSPIFICAEDGTSELDVARFREPTCWEEVLYAVDTLNRSAHEYKTVVLDTVDWLDPMCSREVCRKHGKADIADFDYGDGYTKAREEWRGLLDGLNELRDKRGMGVILLGHSWIKSFENPEGPNYDRYELKLNKKTSSLLKEWVDAVLFATYETFTKKSKEDGGKNKGVASGARIVHTQRMAAWDAGNRYYLPETLPLDWDAFAEAMGERAPDSPEKLKEQIGTMLESVKDKKWHAKVTASVAKAGEDSAELARIANKLSAMVERKAD